MNPTTAESVGRDVLGPIVAEFCLRLWSLGSLMQRPDDAAMLFCARGGLRMQLAYERFLAATALAAPVPVAPLMVSRVAAIRPALVRTLHDGRENLLPSTASTLAYEFSHSTLAEVAHAISGVEVAEAATRWHIPYEPHAFVAMLRHPDSEAAVSALARQASLFIRHLHDSLGRRRHAVLVDTGLYGTTRQLLAEGLTDVEFSSALIARSYRAGLAVSGSRTYGLSVEAADYAPWRRRTAMLRYWHLIEWLFEPELPSVRTFVEEGGRVRSNLELEGWQKRIEPDPATAAAGIFAYLDGLSSGSAEHIVLDAERAWTAFRRAVTRPDRRHGYALTVGTRSHDFGTDGTWSQRPWPGPLAVLRGSSMWREGEIARSGSALRMPMLLAIEAAYTARHLKRALTRPRES